MNNTQFRRLVLDTPTARPSSESQNGVDSTSRSGAGSSTSLGSKKRSSIPMTPRTVLGSTPSHDFARQLAERNVDPSTSSTTRKFRSKAAPKGVKLPSGYRDRALDRAADGEEKDGAAQAESLAARVQALEEMMKLRQIDQPTFEKLRDQVVGGNLESTYLVKGLDYKLLERVRRGEDVYSSPTLAEEADSENPAAEADFDEELDRLEGREVAPIAKTKAEKKGDMAPPPPPATGKKRTRDEILAELRASRQAAAAEKAAAQPSLGPKFRKFDDERRPQARIERDEKGREVLITVDDQGRVKRKVRKAKGVDKSTNGKEPDGLLMPDKSTAPLGMEVPISSTQTAPAAEDVDDDIFEGIGGDYDPLAGMDEDDSSEEDDGEADAELAEAQRSSMPNAQKSTDDVPKESRSPSRSGSPAEQSKPATLQAHRNYFGSPVTASEAEPSVNPLQDPTIIAALRKASSKAGDSASGAELDTAAERRARLLSSHERDDEDIDMGFGSSRFEDDDEDGEGKRVKLSVWGGEGGDESQDGEKRGGGKRKRGPKKKKGDKDSAADVMKVIEGRKTNR